MKLKVLSGVVAGLVVVGSCHYMYSKSIPSGMSLIINDFLQTDESMPFVHEIIKTSKLTQFIFNECKAYKKQRDLCQTRSLENQSVNIEKDYYASLSVTHQSSQEEIKAAYEVALKGIEGDKEDAVAKRKEIVEAYDVLVEPFKKAHYDLERDITEFVGSYKKILFDERFDFLEILYENRSFMDSIFKIALDNIHSDGVRPLMMKFIETPTLDHDFFTKNVVTLDQLYKVALELKEFSVSLKNDFSSAVKKNFNLWMRKQKH